MIYNWEHLFKSYSAEIEVELKNRINEIRQRNEHYIEEYQLLKVIEEIHNDRPYFENSIDKTKLGEKNSSESLEVEFVDGLTSKYLQCHKTINENVFFKHFFEIELKSFTEKFERQHHTALSAGKLSFLSKYLDHNVPFLFKCILQNIIYCNAIWGSFQEHYYSAIKAENTEYVRKYLGIPALSDEKSAIKKVESLARVVAEQKEIDLTQSSIVCLTYLLIDHGVFSQQIGPSEIKKALDILSRNKVNLTIVKEFNNKDILKKYLEGVNNKKDKEELAEKLRSIADLLD